jgi:hypothetical protein
MAIFGQLIGFFNWNSFMNWTVLTVSDHASYHKLSVFVSRFKNLLVAGILIPNSDLKSRINTFFIQDTSLLTQSTILKA